MQIEYPLYLIPLEAGYVSVVSENGNAPGTYYLAVFTDEARAAEFMGQCGIDGTPRPLYNAREFAWMLQSLRAPVTHLAFDPAAHSRTVEASWKVPVAEVLDKHILIDYSPWNYPVYVIEQAGGFASIEGSTSGGEKMVAVGFFGTEDSAREYLRAAGENGEIQPLDTLDEARRFLRDISSEANAVALNLQVEEGRRQAKYCFSIKTVLDKYLVADRGDDRGR